MKEHITKIKEESKQLQSEVRQRTVSYIVGALERCHQISYRAFFPFKWRFHLGKIDLCHPDHVYRGGVEQLPD